ELGTGAKGRRHLRGLEHTQPPARPGADEDDPPAAAQRLRDDLDAARDALFLAVNRGQHLAIFVQHSLDNVRGRELVDGEGGRIDCFGGKRLPLRPGSHYTETSNKPRMVSQSR